ncbi:MAG: hypothetical protein J7L71_10600 [Spirochaetaceae bacterium]|nr:hypothetical protein [Spirochaetaceae bacterium]
MKKIKFIVLMVLIILIYPSCQQIFTYSALEWAQRDPSSLPPAQQISYAKSILSSGDTAAMADAYAVIDALTASDPGNVELQLLAADLAIGGSGITDAIANLDLDNLEDSVETILAGINLDLVAASATHIEAAAALNSEAVSPEQYLNTGLILLAQAAEEAGGFGNLNAASLGASLKSGEAGFATLEKADNFIKLGGGNLSDYGVNNANL